MIKYQDYDLWFVTKIFIPETKLENIQRFIHVEILKKYKNYINKELNIINIELIKINSKTVNIIYEYLVTIGVKDFNDEN